MAKKNKKKHARPAQSDNDEVMQQTYAEMMDTPGGGITMRVEREADVTLRDGLERGFSKEAMEFLHWQVSAWITSRVMRSYDKTGLMPQTVSLEVNVTLDTDGFHPFGGTAADN